MRFAVSLLLSVFMFALAGVGLGVMSGAVPLEWPSGFGVVPARASGTADERENAGNRQLKTVSARRPARGSTSWPTTYGNWTFNCVPVPKSAEKHCAAFQQFRDAESGKTLLLWSIFKDAKGRLASAFRTPADVSLHKGLTVSLARGKSYTIPFAACLEGGCVAQADMAQDFWSALSHAGKADIVVFTAKGRGIRFPMSVSGLSDAVAALSL